MSTLRSCESLLTTFGAPLTALRAQKTVALLFGHISECCTGEQCIDAIDAFQQRWPPQERCASSPTTCSVGAGLDAVIDTLSRLRPDVLCLQECCQKRGPGALQKVADACGLKQVHFFGHTMDESYGNAILTRAPSSVTIRGPSFRRPTPSSRCCRVARWRGVSTPSIQRVAASSKTNHCLITTQLVMAAGVDHRGPPHPARRFIRRNGHDPSLLHASRPHFGERARDPGRRVGPAAPRLARRCKGDAGRGGPQR